MTVLRLAGGHRWSRDKPPWSGLTAVGLFRLGGTGARFDRHYHDCDEYWLILEGYATVCSGNRESYVGPGDLVCTPAGEEHDIIETYTDVRGFFFERALRPGGQPGHLHRDPAAALGHPVPRRPLPGPLRGST